MLLQPSAPDRPAAPARSTTERPRLLDLLLSLIDARLSHVELMDTDWENELERYYRARRVAHRADGAREVAKHH